MLAAQPPVSCEFEGQRFVVEQQSGAGLESVSLRLRWADGEALELPLAPADYLWREGVSNAVSLCDGIAAYSVRDAVFRADPSYLSLWFGLDDRPGYDLLSLVLIDPKARRVLDVKERIAPIKDSNGRRKLTVLVEPSAFWVRLQRQWLHGTGSDGPENAIEDWYRLEIRHARIHTRWIKACEQVEPSAPGGADSG